MAASEDAHLWLNELMPQPSLGRLLIILGVAFFVLSLLGSDGEPNLIAPIMLIFFGRIISAASKQQKRQKQRTVVRGGNGPITLPQPEPSKPKAPRRKGGIEERLREILMVPPMTAPAPGRQQQPKPVTTASAPDPVSQEPARPEPVVESRPTPVVAEPVRREPPLRPMATRESALPRRVPLRTAPTQIAATTTAPATAMSSLSTARPSYSAKMSRRPSAVRRTAPGIKTSAEMVAEAKERLRRKDQTSTAADRRA